MKREVGHYYVLGDNNSESGMNLTLSHDWDINYGVTDVDAISSTSAALAGDAWSGYYAASDRLYKYVSPFIIVIGCVGNILAFIVLQKNGVKGSTATLYLQMIAVADNACLVFGLLHTWLAHVWLDISNLHEAACRAQRFLFYTATDVAVWLLVAFSLDRYIAVCHPLKKNVICSRRRACIIAVVLLVLGVALNGHIFWTRTVLLERGRLDCTNFPQYRYFFDYIRPWLVFVFYMLIPFISVTLLNTGIIRAVWKTSKHHATIAAYSKQKDTFRKSTQHMTLVCICISISFLLLMFPNMVLLVGEPYWKATPGQKALYRLVTSVARLLVFVHHSCNFFFYCLTRVNFRKRLKRMSKPKKKTESYDISVIMTETQQEPVSFL